MNQTETSQVELLVQEMSELFSSVQSVLEGHDFSESLKMPDLMAQLAAKLDWSDKEAQLQDPFVRHFIRRHPNWKITRGPKGGVVPALKVRAKESVVDSEVKSQVEEEISNRIS